MTPHKWAKEIKAWADGIEIEQRHADHTDNKWDNFDGDWGDGASNWKFRIKPQPKEPQYLYIYEGECSKSPIFTFHKSSEHYVNYIGKIKLKDDDNGND